MTSPPASELMRQQVLDRRKQLPPEEASQLSAVIARQFISSLGLHKEKASGQNIALYRALPGELDLEIIEDWFLSWGNSLCYPRVKARAERELEFVEVSLVRQRWQWTVGPYGIQEPTAQMPGMSREDFNLRVNLVFVPGVVFGMKGERIGMGAGFYDRFLASVPAPLRVALAFDFQVQENIEQQSWDQPVDWLLTENREFRGPRVEKWMASL